MKRTLIFLLLFFLATVSGPSQLRAQEGGTAYSTYTLATAKPYANAQTDTLPSPIGAIAVKLGTLSMASLEVSYADSVNLKVYVDTRSKGASNWSVKDSVTITSAANGGGVTEWALRGTAVDRIAGVTNDTRFRFAFQGSENGTSSATYTPRLRYRF